MVNENVVCTVEAPKLIVCQIAQHQLVFILPKLGKAFSTPSVQLGGYLLRHCFEHDAVLYLIEPDDSLTEPIMTGIQTILMCSPDKRRYHEFQTEELQSLLCPFGSLMSYNWLQLTYVAILVMNI